MAGFQLVLGLLLVGLGLFAILRRDRLTEREGARRSVGPTGWTVLGVVLTLGGLVQLVSAAL